MNSTSGITLPWSAWLDETRFALNLPSDLQIELLAPADQPAIAPDAIRRAVRDPAFGPPIRELARGSKTACIAVDDLARPTRASDILPIVFSELREAGIEPSGCTIVIATGTHADLREPEIELKIGRQMMESGVAIEVHKPERLAPTGLLYGNDPLHINRAFLEAEFKLGISSVLPHSFAGFSGGAKMMLPGLANIEATARFHKFVQMGLRSGAGLDKNRFRQEIETLAVQLGFRFTICVVTNRSRETAAVVAGDIVDAHRSACEQATAFYRTPCQGRFDAMVLNAYPKDTDLIQAENVFTAFKGTGFDVVSEQGVIVLCTSAKCLGEHGLFAPGGKNHVVPRANAALKKRDFWILAPNISEEIVRQRYWEGYRYFSDSHQLGIAIQQRLGTGARVGVVPCAPMQQLVHADAEASS